MAVKAVKHEAIYEDRGIPHRHRHHITCSCGWTAPPFRLKATARSTWEGHHRQATGAAGRPRKAGALPGPQPLTPAEDLPPGW